ncbi:unnamed protein product [Owenia fusiformis]|uniref:Uncharacterized protein n=1 Tax=Owenia fusiformis TaxID=6347 RepID=A0A8S4N6W5_OWEFU|nr:unnamed protein product [Owenia fusiformis]
MTNICLILAVFSVSNTRGLAVNFTYTTDSTTQVVNSNVVMNRNGDNTTFFVDDNRTTILVGNLIGFTTSTDYDLEDAICQFAERAIQDVNKATELFPMFKLKLDPCIDESNVASVNGRLWDYIYRGRDTPFMLSFWQGQAATIPVCAKWGCIERTFLPHRV